MRFLPIVILQSKIETFTSYEKDNHLPFLGFLNDIFCYFM